MFPNENDRKLLKGCSTFFYTTEGFTQVPDGESIENCQILAFVEAEGVRQAWRKFKKENAWMKGRGFSLDMAVCRALVDCEMF